MKNFALSVLIILSMTGFSFAGECTNGLCNRPAERIVAPSKVVAKEVVKTPRRIVSGCLNGKCNSKSVVRVR